MAVYCPSAISCFENFLFSSLAHLLIGLLEFLVGFLNSSHSPDADPLSDIQLAKTLTPLSSLSLYSIVSFALRKLSSFLRSHLSLLSVN